MKIKKRDIFFILSVFLGVLIIFLLVNFVFVNKASYVQVTIGDKDLGNYPLVEDLVLPIEDSGGHVGNTLKISGGKACMLSADCPDKTCVNQGAIDKAGQTIICLPHKVIIRAYGEDSGEDILIR